MRVGVYSKALEELTPRAVRDADPDRAVEDWAVFARDLGASSLQLAAAMHPADRDVPPEAMLDPVANTLDLRAPLDSARARRVRAAVDSAGIELSDLGYFDNLLHHDRRERDKKHAHLRRVFDAAVLLGVDAVCGFVGRNLEVGADANLALFESQVVPLLRDARDRGLVYRVEQCPMPGWTTRDSFLQQPCVHACGLDRPAPHLRAARRRGHLPDSLRSLARHPARPGYAQRLPVSEGSRLRVPDRGVPRQGPGD